MLMLPVAESRLTVPPVAEPVALMLVNIMLVFAASENESAFTPLFTAPPMIEIEPLLSTGTMMNESPLVFIIKLEEPVKFIDVNPCGK